MAQSSSGYKEIEVQEVSIEGVEVEHVIEALHDLQPRSRLAKPHNLFPFDILNGRHHTRILENGQRLGINPDVITELKYVRDHCMVPPFPWGQIIYTSFIKGNILQQDIPGDFAELGIGQGGMSIYLARLAKKFSRKFLAVDSFEGLPPPDMGKDNHYFVEGDYRPNEGIDQKQQFIDWSSKYDVDDVLYVRKAFFKDLEIPSEFDKFAFVHMDSDLYDSVYDSFEKVWDRISPGGAVAIDDFFHHAQGPARAVADFFRTRGNPKGEPPLLYPVPPYAVVIVKGRSAFLESAPSGGKRRGTMHSPRALDGNYYSFKMVRMCKPFINAVEESALRAAAACQQDDLSEKDRVAVERCRVNAEAFLGFLKYPDDAPRSGSDIQRYLWPMEDQWDVCQGTLCGLQGEARKTIEIAI